MMPIFAGMDFKKYISLQTILKPVCELRSLLHHRIYIVPLGNHVTGVLNEIERCRYSIHSVNIENNYMIQNKLLYFNL